MAGSIVVYYRNHSDSDNTRVNRGGASFPSPESLGFSAPEGKIFDSWNTSRDGSGTTYHVGEYGETVAVLYAIWVIDLTGSDVTITYNGSAIAGLSVTGSKTLNTAGKYCSGSVVVSYTKPALQSKTVTPTTSVQNVTPDSSVYGLSQVTVNAIPSAYIIPSGTITLSSSGTFDVASYASADVTVTGGDPLAEWYKDVALNSRVLDVANYDSSVLSSALAACSNIYSYAFNGRSFSGSFAFPNVTTIAEHAFGSIGGITNTGSEATFSFPLCSVVRSNAFDFYTFPFKIYFSSALTGAGLEDSAFYNCFKLNEVHMPNVTSISADYLFYRCSSLSTINLQNLEKIEAQYVFNGAGLYGVSFSKLSAISYGFNFASCQNLREINLSLITELSGQHTFANNPLLTTISLSNLSIINGYSMFASCAGLSYVILPALTKISASGTQCFGNCGGLISAEFPQLNTVIAAGMFSSCSNLLTVSLPRLQSISASNMFSSCRRLKEINLPEYQYTAVTSNMFFTCYSLSTVSFPKTSKLSGLSMFRSCYQLVSIFLRGSSLTALGNTIASMFFSTPVSTYSTAAGRWASIFVPSSLLASYKAATNWTTVSSKIFAYEDYFDAEGNPK